jgi:hypothetical protein
MSDSPETAPQKKEGTPRPTQYRTGRPAGRPGQGFRALPLEEFAEEAFLGLFKEIKKYNQRAFLIAFVMAKSVWGAARLCHVNPSLHTYWKKVDPEYAKAFEEATEMLCDMAEGEVYRRGIEGWEETLSFQGKLTGDKVKRYSDNLAMFFLKRYRPEFRDNYQVQVSGKVIHEHKHEFDSAGFAQLFQQLIAPKQQEAIEAEAAEIVAPEASPSE